MNSQLTIALDFDDTVTADPDCWREVIAVLRKYNHRVVCCTLRHNTPENRREIRDATGLPVYFCEHPTKRETMEAAGVHVDIWIDDQPKYCEPMESPGAKIA